MTLPAMYALTNTSTYHFPPVSRASASETYVTAIRRLARDSFATISSDQQLSLFHAANIVAGPAASLRTNHGNVTGLQVFGEPGRGAAQDGVVCTSGEDGSVGVWDLRAGREVVRFHAAEAPILSMACSAATNTIAVGTELVNHSASIHIWDVRNTPSAKASFADLHSDDITTLAFHPSPSTHPSTLLSGSTDGLVSVYDLSVPDEDDMTLQTFNHNASIHHAGFLTPTEVVALSHDEKLAVYAVDPERQGADAAVDFGDVRAPLGCQYVADVTPKMDGSGAVLGAGRQAERAFGLTFLARSRGGEWALDGAGSVALPGGHGEEIVRGFCFFDEDMAVFTAGEDGCVKAWGAGG